MHGGVEERVAFLAILSAVRRIVKFDAEHGSKRRGIAKHKVNVLGFDAVEQRLMVGLVGGFKDVGETNFGEDGESVPNRSPQGEIVVAFGRGEQGGDRPVAGDRVLAAG